MTPCDCNHEMGDTCPKCAPTKPPVVLVANDSGGFDFPSGYLAVWGADPEWRCNNSGVNGSGLAHVGPTFATAKEAAAAIGALLPPRVGDKWGDLTPEQRAMVPVGSELGPVSESSGLTNTLVKVAATAEGLCWASLTSAGTASPPHDHDPSVSNRRTITRLGPATEPDRSGWPVLVEDGVGYYKLPSGLLAVWSGSDGEWYSDPNGGVGTEYGTAREAADAIGARPPDEVSEAGQAVAPQPVTLRRRTPAEATAWHAGAEYALGLVLERLDGSTSPVAVVREVRDAVAFSRASAEPALTPQPPPTNTTGDVWQARAEAAEAKIATLTAEVDRLAAALTTALRDANEADNEAADLRRALEGQTLANAPLRDALSALRGRLAHVLPDGPVTDDALVAAVRKLADREGDEAMLTAGLGLLDQAAWGNPTLGYIATVIRRGVGR